MAVLVVFVSAGLVVVGGTRLIVVGAWAPGRTSQGPGSVSGGTGLIVVGA